MYLRHFGLRQPPFSIAPDPRYLYMSERHREALAHLLYGLDAGGGFVLLTGEIGTGKTTVCRCFLEQVPAACDLAYIFNPKLTAIELLHTVCDEFGIEVRPAVPGAPTVKDHLDPLNRHLLAAHAEGRQCVLAIDEAQNLSADVLEQLRLLTNLETNERKLLQIVLIGQPELRTLLARPELEQLAQRVVARFHLDALSAAETAGYIAHRLAVAGHTGPLPFDRTALRQVQRLTGGVPRRINLLCDRALLGAYAEGRERVDGRIVKRAAVEAFGGGDRQGGYRSPRRMAAAGAVAAALAGVALGVAVGAATGVPWPWRQAVPSAASAALPAATAPLETAKAAATAGPAPSMPPLSGSIASASATSGATAMSSAPSAAPPVALPATASLDAPVATARPAARAELTSFDGARDLPLLPRDERGLWRELAAGWAPTGTDANGSGDPCAAGAALRCYRTASATLATIRLLDRPGLMALMDDSGRLRYARLIGLDRQGVRLAAGTRAWSMPLDALAGRWRGSFATLWQPPPGYTGPLAEGASGPAVQALAAGLTRLWADGAVLPAAASAASAPDKVFDTSLRARLAAFQLAQGLQADGIAGPTSFMLLNRALGVAEPRLDSAADATPPAPARK